jgi:WD40 repeat protein
MEDLGPLPKQVTDVCISDDGLHYAAVMPSGSRQVVNHDGKPGPQFDEIGSWGGPAIVLPKNGAHVAYIARRGSQRFIVIDGKEIPVELSGAQNMHYLQAELRDQIKFSPDGKHFFYAATGAGNFVHLVLEGKEKPDFESIESPVFSEEGSHYAYVATKDGQKVLVVDGKVATPLDQEIFRLQFSRDGKHHAYGRRSGDKAVVVLDGKPQQEYRDIAWETIYLSPTGRLCYQATKDEGESGTKSVAVFDGKESVTSEISEKLLFSPDGKHFAYVTTSSDGTSVVVDGKAGRPYDTIQNLQFSPDGSRVSYTARTPSGEFAVVDEEESEAFHSVSKISFSENGKRFAYVGSTDKGAVVVVDGKPGKTYREFQSLALSPDGSRYAYEALINFGEPEVVIDGKAVRTNLVATLEPAVGNGDKMVFRFSPNSKHLAMASMVSGGARYGVTVDGVTGPTNGFCQRFTFSPDSSHFAYVTRENTRGGWNTVSVTLDHKIVQSIPTSPTKGDMVMIAQVVEDSRNTGFKRVNPEFFKFREDGKLKCLVVKDERIYRVSVAPGAAMSLPQTSVSSTPSSRRINTVPRTGNSRPGAANQGQNGSPFPGQPPESELQGESANDVSGEQPATKSSSDAATGAASVAKQVVQQLSHGDAESLGALYAETVDYMNSGSISNAAVRNQLRQFFERWPVRQWTITAPVKVESQDPLVQEVTFSVRYDLKNPQTGKHTSGTAEERLTVSADSSGAMKIISQHEQTK